MNLKKNNNNNNSTQETDFVVVVFLWVWKSVNRKITTTTTRCSNVHSYHLVKSFIFKIFFLNRTGSKCLLFPFFFVLLFWAFLLFYFGKWKLAVHNNILWKLFFIFICFLFFALTIIVWNGMKMDIQNWTITENEIKIKVNFSLK